MTPRESAVEHLRNGQQMARNLHDLLSEKGLHMLAGDVAAIEARIVRALDEMALGNLGRAAPERREPSMGSRTLLQPEGTYECVHCKYRVWPIPEHEWCPKCKKFAGWMLVGEVPAITSEGRQP